MPFTSQTDPVVPTATNPASMPSSSVRLVVDQAAQIVGAPPMPQSSRWVPPTNGQQWPRFGQKIRQTTTLTTTSLAAAAAYTGVITLAPSYRLLHITTDRAARVRLYGTAAERDADLTRQPGTDPSYGAGVMLDYVTVASVLSADLSPLVDGYSAGSVPSASIPITVTNLSGSTSTVTVTLTYIQTE